MVVMPKGRPSFEAKSRKTSVDSSEGKLAMMAVIACSLLLPIASDDEWLPGSGREDIFGFSRSMSCFALREQDRRICEG